MKHLITFLLTLFIVFGSPLHAQKTGYWYGNHFVEFTKVNRTKPALIVNKERIRARLHGVVTSPNYLHYLNEPVNLAEKDIYTSASYLIGATDSAYILPRILLKLKPLHSIEYITSLFEGQLEPHEYKYGVHRLDCNVSNSDEVFRIVSLISKEEGIEWVEPVIQLPIKLSDDLYYKQYYLKNTGAFGGTAGIDINAEEAWHYITGDSTITVAVIDTGVDEDHEDLLGVVESGYTAGYPTQHGQPFNTTTQQPKSHGIACAGIIAANNNGLGITGIAAGVKILPINIFPEYPTNDNLDGISEFIADAINWAYPRADILSCSWHLNEVNNYVTDAINNATLLGRNGKGTIVVFAAGNKSSSSLNYPASLPNVFAVGAITRNGYRYEYSNYGTGLDIVAVSALYEELGIVTLDRMGVLGKYEGNYNEHFNGTSAACPQVAAVAALMLSANPDLTASEVKSIIQSTARKLPAYTYTNGWNNETGYGLADAGAAVLQSFNYQIAGQDIPEVNSVYTISNLPQDSAITVSWSWTGTQLAIQHNTPSAYQITINNSSKQYIKGTLTAAIKRNGVTYKTLTKSIDTADGIQATIHQAAFNTSTWSYPEFPTIPIYFGNTYNLYKKGLITLHVPSDAIVTYTSIHGVTPTAWTDNGHGTISFYFNYFSPSVPIILESGEPQVIPNEDYAEIQVTGRFAYNYKCFQFNIKAQPPTNGTSATSSLMATSHNGIIEVSVPEDATGDGGVIITIANAHTGEVKIQDIVTSGTHRYAANGWPKGIYVASVTQAGQTQSRKLIVE